jgi:hypothetical protein
VSDEPKKSDPIEVRWQPVAIVSLGEEKPKLTRVENALLDICGGIVCLAGIFYGARIATLLVCCWGLFAIALWIAVRFWWWSKK